MVVKRELEVDSVKNPQWDMYLSIVNSSSLWLILGYATPEECVEGLYNIKQWEYSEDYDRYKLDIPWLSTKIQGVKGTQQVHVEIKEVKSGDGDAEAMSALLTVRGDGMLKLPLNITSIPVGRYVVSLNIYNEGYSHDVDDVFTIIVK